MNPQRILALVAVSVVLVACKQTADGGEGEGEGEGDPPPPHTQGAQCSLVDAELDCLRDLACEPETLTCQPCPEGIAFEGDCIEDGCWGDGDCPDPLVCAGEMDPIGSCVPLGSDGARCFQNDNSEYYYRRACAEGLVCITDVGGVTATCGVADAGQGDSCSGGYTEVGSVSGCADPLVCDGTSETCQPP